MGTAMTAPPDFLASIPQESPERFHFAGMPTRRSAKKTAPSKFQLLESFSELHDELIGAAIAQTTREGFEKARLSHFGSYQRLMRSLSNLIPIAFEPATIERLSSESLDELHQQFVDECAPRFGEAVRDQATFTV